MTVKTRRPRTELDAAQLQAVAELFAALSEPTRLRILQVLQSGPKNVGQIVELTKLKQANVSKQLGMLHQAGLVKRQKLGNVVEYSIRMTIVFDLCKLVCSGLRESARSRLGELN